MTSSYSPPIRTSNVERGRSRFMSSPLHSVFREVNARANGGNFIAHLHVGEPGFPPPEEVGEAMHRCYREGRAGYGDAAGSLELRELIREKLLRENRLSVHVEQILITPGSTQGLYAALTALTTPADRVLLPLPFWPVYAQQCAALSLEPAFYSVSADGCLDVDQIESQLEQGVGAIVVNTPANPSGTMLSVESLQGLLDATAPYGTPIICDEAYEDFAFGNRHVSMATLEPARSSSRRVVTTFTFSKTFAMTGLRLGYIVAPTVACAETLGRVQEACLVCPSTLVQAGGVAAMRVRDAAVDRARSHLLEARRIALPRLEAAGLLMQEPHGGWYALCEHHERAMGAEDFVHRLLHRTGVGVAPGWPFFARRGMTREMQANGRVRFRVALCGPHEQLRRGIESICTVAGEEA